MDVDCFLMCDGAHALNGKVYILGGGWNTIWAVNFPNDHRLSIALGLRVGWNETNVKHDLALAVLDSDNQPVQQLATGQFETGRPPGIKPGTDQLVHMAFDTTVHLAGPSDLQVALSVDDQLIKSIPFTAIQAPPHMVPPNMMPPPQPS